MYIYRPFNTVYKVLNGKCDSVSDFQSLLYVQLGNKRWHMKSRLLTESDAGTLIHDQIVGVSVIVPCRAPILGHLSLTDNMII